MNLEPNSSVSKRLYLAGGAAAFLFLVYSIVTMAIMVVYGAQPVTAQEAFTMLEANRLLGLLRMDLLTVVFIPLYYVIFLGIYLALDGQREARCFLAIIAIFAGITLLLATPSALAMLNLSDKYALAASAEQKSQLLAAGEAILAADMWHGTGAVVGSFLIQIGALILSIAMLPGKVFNKFTAYVGILTHGLDLAHLVFLLILPSVGGAIMAAAGTLYLVWLPLIGGRLVQVGREG